MEHKWLASWILLWCLGVFAAPAWAADATQDPWRPLRRFIGDWVGTTSGQAGNGEATRSYRFVLNGRYLNEVSASRYPPKGDKAFGEVHEHWSMFSHDKSRKALALRQFHVEGFVNTYRQSSEGDATPLVFESEAFENFSNAWKARESYEFVSADEFIEVFELAAPGKPYEVYSRTHFTRAAR